MAGQVIDRAIYCRRKGSASGRVPPTKPIPGTLQEGGTPFHTTHWTVVLQAGKAETDESAQRALSIFSETYWAPLYTFVRRRGYPPADAQDIVQGFFERFFKQNALSRADQEKGRLRTFLLAALQNYMMDEHGRASALTRRRPAGRFAGSENCGSRGGAFGEHSPG